MQGLLSTLQKNTWNSDLAVKIKVAGNLSERAMDDLRMGICCDGIDKETGQQRRAVLVRHPRRPKVVIYVPTPIVARWRWVPRYHRVRGALGLSLSEDGELCTRNFMTEVKNLIVSDLDLGLLSEAYVWQPTTPSRVVCHMVSICLMADGFPLNTQSIEHMCIGNSSSGKGLNQSEAGLITLAVARMSEKNATMHTMFKQAGVDVGDAELRANPIVHLDELRCVEVEVVAGADKKGVEVNRGCGNSCPWCMCSIDMIHIRPWPRGYQPGSMDEIKKKLVAAGCQGIVDEAVILEAAHLPLPGQTLPQPCRFCAATTSTPWYKVKPMAAKRPYPTASAFQAAKAAAASSAAAVSKEGMRTHATNRQAFARKHGHQHEFHQPTLAGGMKRWIPELLHALPLNAGRQTFKQKAMRLCDSFTREQAGVFFKGMGAPINLAKKETGRSKAERWWKGSTWDELVRGGTVAKGGMAPWVASLALLIGDCHEDARAGGGRHRSSLLPKATATAPPRTGGFDIASDSDDEPPTRPPSQPAQPERPDNELTLDELAEQCYGKSLGSQLVSMVNGFDCYRRMHVLLMEPPNLLLGSVEGKEKYAIDVAVAINDTFYSVEDSSTLGPAHKSYTWHELLFIIVPFIAERGDLWPWSTARLEARGARAKVVERSVVLWAKKGVCKRSISKRERTTGKKALRGGPERTSAPFTQAYNSSGVQQLLGAQGLREQMLRNGKIAPKKSNRLGRLGRTTAPRQTHKWEEDYSDIKALSCRKAFELCLRKQIPRFYDVQGVRGDWNAALQYLEREPAGAL